jgi:hypothetical protein
MSTYSYCSFNPNMKWQSRDKELEIKKPPKHICKYCMKCGHGNYSFWDYLNYLIRNI